MVFFMYFEGVEILVFTCGCIQKTFFLPTSTVSTIDVSIRSLGMMFCAQSLNLLPALGLLYNEKMKEKEREKESSKVHPCQLFKSFGFNRVDVNVGAFADGFAVDDAAI